MFHILPGIARLDLWVVPSQLTLPAATLHLVLDVSQPGKPQLVLRHSYTPRGELMMEFCGALARVNLALELPPNGVAFEALPLIPPTLTAETEALVRAHYREQTARLFEKLPWHPNQEKILRCQLLVGGTPNAEWVHRRQIRVAGT